MSMYKPSKSVELILKAIHDPDVDQSYWHFVGKELGSNMNNRLYQNWIQVTLGVSERIRNEF